MTAPVWSTACPDWERRIVARESLIPCGPLFPEEAAAAMAVFDALCIVDVPGHPTFGESMRPWFRDLAATIFGSYDAENGRRLIQEFMLLISKKNIKSTGAAGIGLTMLVRDWRSSDEILILAPTIEIANNSFYPARDAVRANEELSDLLQIQDHYRTITHRETKAQLKVVAADSETVSGKKASIVIVDELWLFGKKSSAENMLREATGGLASRPEGFVLYLTTQSDEPPAGVFKQKLEYARDVRDGRVVDNKFLPVLYEFPAEMVKAKAFLDIGNLYITNPNLGASVDEEFLAREFKKAERAGAGSLAGFLAKHANVETGVSLKEANWAGAEFWEQQTRAGLDLQQLVERCEVIDVGIDGGGLDDLLGLDVSGREKGTGHWLTWTHAWAHPSVLARRKEVAPRLLDFRDDGDLTMVDRIGDDVAEVANIVHGIETSGKLDKVGVDPHGIGAILDALVEIGVPSEKIVAIAQGWKMVGAVKTAERKLAGGEMWHGGQRLMTWCVGNAKVVPVGNAIMVSKQVSGSAKIDPLMALFNSVSLLALNPEAISQGYSLHIM
jgi:phage terminase large subunit-like protein